MRGRRKEREKVIEGEDEGEKRIKKRVVTKLTIHTRPRAPGVPGNGANDMPGPSLVNGTFREFLDGFVELGIPRTGPRRAAFPFARSFGSLFLSGSSRVSRISADSIKRSWWNALWETLLPFVSLSLSLPLARVFFLFSSRLVLLVCRLSLSLSLFSVGTPLFFLDDVTASG